MFISIYSIFIKNRAKHFPLWVQKRPFLFNLDCPNLIWFFTQNPGFLFLLYFIYNSLSYPLPSLWVLLVLVKFSWSWILAILKITLLINCQRECLVLFRQDMVGMGGEINFDTYFSTQQTMTGTYVILGQHVLDAWRS